MTYMNSCGLETHTEVASASTFSLFLNILCRAMDTHSKKYANTKCTLHTLTIPHSYIEFYKHKINLL